MSETEVDLSGIGSMSTLFPLYSEEDGEGWGKKEPEDHSLTIAQFGSLLFLSSFKINC